MSLAEGDDLDVIWQRTQTTIKTIENLCQSKGLNISALKTKIVMFTWNRKWSLRPIEVCGKTIELSNEVKRLGITLDSKLTFNTHIDNIIKKFICTLFQCKRAIGPTWGLSPKICHWIYTAIIRPTLAYCSIVWIRAVENKTNTKRLERVQGMTLKYLAGAMRSTPHLQLLQHLTISQEHPTSPTILKEKLQRGLMGQGDWTLETSPSGKGIIKAHSTLSKSSFIPLRGGSPLKFWKTRFRDNGCPKSYTQWANFLVGFVAQKPYGATVVATPIFRPKWVLFLKVTLAQF